MNDRLIHEGRHKWRIITWIWQEYSEADNGDQARSDILYQPTCRHQTRQRPASESAFLERLDIAVMTFRRLRPVPIRTLLLDSKQQPRILYAPAIQHTAALHVSVIRNDVPQWPNPPVPQPVVTPYQDPRANQDGGGGGGKKGTSWKEILENLSTNPLFGAMLTTVVGLAAV